MGTWNTFRGRLGWEVCCTRSLTCDNPRCLNHHFLSICSCLCCSTIAESILNVFTPHNRLFTLQQRLPAISNSLAFAMMSSLVCVENMNTLRSGVFFFLHTPGNGDTWIGDLPVVCPSPFPEIYLLRT